MLGSEGRVLRYCSHADCRRFKHPSDFESEEPRATCRKHKKEPPEAKKESQGHEARVHGATARDAGGEGLMEGTPIMEGTYIMGNEIEEPPAKQQCLSPRGGARVHAPARSPGDSTRSDIDEDSEAEPERCANFTLEELLEMQAEATTTNPATAPRSDIDEDLEADMGFVVDTFSPEELLERLAEATEATTTTPATAPRSDIDEDSEADMGFVVDTFSPDEDIQKPGEWDWVTDELGKNLKTNDLGMRGDNSLQWEGQLV